MKSSSARYRAYAVHLFTACGAVMSLLAMIELMAPDPRPAMVFVWLAAAGVIDALDGPLARRWQVGAHAPAIDGAKLDDIIDYLNFTFIPLLLVWRMHWLPDPALLWILPALLTSLFGFTNVRAKQADAGFFLGFPSYWNIVAFYAGLWFGYFGPWPMAGVFVACALLTVLPVRFIYPNRVASKWRRAIIGGGVIWFGLLLAMLPTYPASPQWLMWLSLVYPGFYLFLSVFLQHKPD